MVLGGGPGGTPGAGRLAGQPGHSSILHTTSQYAYILQYEYQFLLLSLHFCLDGGYYQTMDLVSVVTLIYD